MCFRASRPDCCLSWNARVSRLKQLCQRGKPQLPGCQSTGWYFRRDLSTTKQVNQPVNEPVFDSISKRGESVEAVWNGQIQSNHIGGGTISTSISNRTSQALYSTLCYTRDKLMATLALIRTWRTVRSEICNQNIELSENHISTISSSGTISRGIGGISNDSKDRDISNHTRYSADNKSTEVTSVDKMFQAHNYLIQCKPFVHTKTTYVI